ncbi:MAG: hypothetical protein ACXAC5_23270 [Promethearchaeota archaeon]|jgi:hypothetical protein
MEKSKKLGLEKSTVLNGYKIQPKGNKEKIVNKIDSLWDNDRKSKYECKKLLIKLETTGKEKRKISLKLECGNSNVQSANYTLISELLKEFFNNENIHK